MNINFVMIGCGGFSRRYHVGALLADKQLRLGAIFDPHPTDAVRDLARVTGATLVDRIEDLPPTQGTTACLVTTPHTLHADHARAVLSRGWHAMIDKPMVMTIADADDLIARAAKANVVNAVAFNRRLDPGCVRARAIIAAGGIGKVAFVQTVQLGYERAGWFLDPALGGGGPYTGRGTHMADIVPWLTGLSPTRLRARLRGGSPTRSDRGGFIEILCGDTEWQVSCVEEGWHMWDEIRVFGDDGLIELRRPLNLPIGWTMQWRSRRGDALEELAADATPGASTRNFLDAVRGKGTVACSFTDARKSVSIIAQAFASARDGGWRDL